MTIFKSQQWHDWFVEFYTGMPQKCEYPYRFSDIVCNNIGTFTYGHKGFCTVCVPCFISRVQEWRADKSNEDYDLQEYDRLIQAIKDFLREHPDLALDA